MIAITITSRPSTDVNPSVAALLIPTEMPVTPDWTTIPIATKIAATIIPNATLPFASSFCSSTSLVTLPKTRESDIQCYHSKDDCYDQLDNSNNYR